MAQQLYLPIYFFIRTQVGLLIHPYKTMQDVIKSRRALWMSFSPTLIMSIFLIIWWVLIRNWFTVVPFVGTWAFVLIWGVCFFAFWQIMLFYLLVRFLISLR